MFLMFLGEFDLELFAESLGDFVEEVDGGID